MFIKSWEEYLAKVEDLLSKDPWTTRLVLKYHQRLKLVQVSVRADKAVLSHLMRVKDDAKKIEVLAHRVSEVLSNRKGAQATQVAAEGDKADQSKKKKKGAHRN